MVIDLGLTDYEDALKLQHELVAKRSRNMIKDSMLLVEHPSVFTIGRSGSRANLLADEIAITKGGMKVLDVDRGGDITFHSPGQLVAYPVIDLKEKVRDLHKYLRSLEEVVIRFLDRYDVEGFRREDATGVWASSGKISSIGIAAKDWVTYHGLSININNDLSPFLMMNPCGMKGLKVSSLKQITARDINMYEAKKIFLNEFNEYCAAVA